MAVALAVVAKMAEADHRYRRYMAARTAPVAAVGWSYWWSSLSSCDTDSWSCSYSSPHRLSGSTSQVVALEPLRDPLPGSKVDS